MKYCNKCYGEIADQATKCPHCGSVQSKVWSRFTNFSAVVGVLSTVVSLAGAAASYNYKEDVMEALKNAEKAQNTADASLKRALSASQQSFQALSHANEATERALKANNEAELLKLTLRNTKDEISTIRKEAKTERNRFIAELDDLSRKTERRLKDKVFVQHDERGFAIDFDKGVRVQWGIITVNDESEDSNRFEEFPFPFGDNDVAISMTYRNTDNTTLASKTLKATNVKNDGFLPKIVGKEIIFNYDALDVEVSYIAIGKTPR